MAEIIRTSKEAFTCWYPYKKKECYFEDTVPCRGKAYCPLSMKMDKEQEIINKVANRLKLNIQEDEK
jgi:hypothetical protein